MTQRGRMVSAAALGLAMIAAAPVNLKSNRATYNVSLGSALPGGIVAVNGRIVIEFRVTCAGYETVQRFVSDMSDAQSNVSRSDFLVTATEAQSGRTMDFDITNMVDGQIAERYQGRATREDDGSGEVALASAGGSGFALPEGTIFPTMQTIAVLDAAEAGEHSVDATVFQGGDKSDLYSATSTIGQEATSPNNDVEDADGMLNGVPAWPVLMSYYPMTGDAETPNYEISARLYANGVIGSMSMVYPRFTLKADLQKVESLPAPKCDSPSP